MVSRARLTSLAVPVTTASLALVTAAWAAAGDLPPGAYAARWGGPFRRMRIFGGPPGTDVLFGPHPVLTVRPRSAMSRPRRRISRRSASVST